MARIAAALALALYCQPCFSFISCQAPAAPAPRSMLPLRADGRARLASTFLRLEMGARSFFKRKALTGSALLSLAVASPVSPARAALVQWDSQNQVLPIPLAATEAGFLRLGA